MARALTRASRKIRSASNRAREDELLEYVGALNSQVIFDSIDRSDIEPWIVNMASYRRAFRASEHMVAYEAPRRELLRMLRKMGIESVRGPAVPLRQTTAIRAFDRLHGPPLPEGF